MNEKLIKRDEGTEATNSITTWLQSLASEVVTAFGVCENGLNYWA